MTEQEAAVRWLERDYDKYLQIRTTLDVICGEPVMRFWSRFRGSSRGPMFTLKEQNG